MEKILSKEEIADLLSAVKHGEINVDAGDADAEQLPMSGATKRAANVEACTLIKTGETTGWKFNNYDIILDSFARNYAISLSTRFQRSVQVKLNTLESLTFDSLLQRLSGRGAIGVMGLEPLSGGGLLIFDEALSFMLLEIVLGGGNIETQAPIPERGMSAIELNVIRNVVQAACPELSKGFSPLEEIEATLIELVSNLRLLNFVDPQDGVIAGQFKVAIDDLEGHITLVVPHEALEPLRRKQQNKIRSAHASHDSRWQATIGSEINHLELELEAVLATLSLRVRDILNFQVGDVIDLGCKPGSPLQVNIEGRPKFFATAGVQDGKKALQVQGRIPNGG